MHSQLNPRTVKDKANHAVILDKATSDKLYKDVQSYRLITVATLVDRLKINGSLARQALKDLEDKGQIKKVVGHSKLSIYSKDFYPFLLSLKRWGIRGWEENWWCGAERANGMGKSPPPHFGIASKKRQSSNG